MISKETMQKIIDEEAEKASAGSGYDAEDLIEHMQNHDSVWEMTEEGVRQFYGYYFTDMVSILRAEEEEDH
jgi:archaellum component FlaC